MLFELTCLLGRQTTWVLFYTSILSPSNFTPERLCAPGGPWGQHRYTLLCPTSSHWVQPMRGRGKKGFYSSRSWSIWSIIPIWVYLCVEIPLAASVCVFLSHIMFSGEHTGGLIAQWVRIGSKTDVGVTLSYEDGVRQIWATSWSFCFLMSKVKIIRKLSTPWGCHEYQMW